MGNKVIDGSIEWVKDSATGVVSGYKKADGSEVAIITAEINQLTGSAIWTAAEFAAITPESGKFYLVGN
jgi:hypothetical protein